LVVSLAAVAGFVDSISVARLTGTFVAFQSGNVVLIGLGTTGGRLHELLAPATAVVSFIIGSALAATIARLGGGPSQHVQQRLLACTAGLLVCFAALVLLSAGFGSERPSGALRFIGIVVAAVAMALQTPAVRQVGGVPVSSTFVTGVMSRLGQALSDLVHDDARARELRFLHVLGLTTVAFLGGAIAGGVCIKEVGNTAVLVPAAALVVVTFVVRRADVIG
jgi:uncharacterized membrane protein YoaK (UPF0700 family)